MIIGYENLLESATVTADEEATGFEIENGYDWRLDDWWKATSTSAFTVINIDIDCGSSQSADYVGLVGHNFSSAVISFKVQHDDNSGYSSPTDALGATALTSDGVALKTFTSASDRYWRIAITMLSSAPPIIGHLSLGARYAPPVGMQSGAIPPKYGIQTKTMPNIGDTGLYLGSSTLRDHYESTIEMNLLTAAQMRTDIDPLTTHVISKPFFYNWDNTNYPTESAYCWLSGDPNISTSSPLYHSVRLPIRAVV